MSDAPPLLAARLEGLRSDGGPADSAAPKLAAAVSRRADALTGQPVMDKADLTTRYQMSEDEGLRPSEHACPEGSQPGGDTRAGTGAEGRRSFGCRGSRCGVRNRRTLHYPLRTVCLGHC